MARRERRKPIHKKKGGFFGKVFCLFLGFILGVVGTIGGIGGLGYYVVTQVKIKDAVGTANSLAGTNIQYTDFVTEEYGNGTSLELIQGIAAAATKLQDGTGSLNTLNEISPLVGKNVQNLIETLSGFGVKMDYATLMSTPFAKLGEYITNTVNDTEIALLVESVTKNEVAGLLALICYGEKGEDYIVNDEGKVVMLGSSTSATIGSLTNSDMLNDRLSNLSFLSLMSALGEVNAEDPIIRTLVYGVEGKDYEMTDHDEDPTTPDAPTPCPKVYTFGEMLTNPEDPTSATTVFTAPDETVFTFTQTGVWTAQNGATIVQLDGENEYQYEVLDADSNVVYQLKHLTNNDYQAYIDGVAQVRKGPYLNDVMGENADLLGIVGEVRLGDLLGLNGNSDAILLSIAYGEKDKDYTVDATGKIIPADGAKPVTINDLMAEDGGLALIEDVPLATLLEIESPIQEGVESIMVILAFGEEGTHYRTFYENNVKCWEWLTNTQTGEPYSERTVGYLIDNGNESMFNDLTIEMLMNVTAKSDGMMRALAFGNEDTHYVLVDGNPDDGDDTPNTVKMLPMRYFISGTTVYDEEHKKMGTLGAEVASGIFEVALNNGKTQYISHNASGGYDVFLTLENAQNNDPANENDLRIYHSKTKLSDLRGENASTRIERIELAAALNIDLFATGEDAADPLMIQLAYGIEGKHYEILPGNVLHWLSDTDPNSDTFGLKYHARTIHDMRDTGALIEDIYLATVLDLNASSPAILLALAYGKDYKIEDGAIVSEPKNTIGDLMGANADALIKDIYLDTALQLNGDSPAIMLALAFGNDYVINADNTVSSSTRNTLGMMMGNESKALVEGVYLNTIVSADADDAIMNFILYGETKPTASSTPRTLGEFMNDSSAIVDNMMKTLTLREALGSENVESDKILQHVADCSLDTIGDQLHVLSVQAVMENDIYRYMKLEPKNDGSGLYNAVANPNESSVEAVLCNTVLNSDGSLKGYLPVQRVADTVEGNAVYRNYTDMSGNPVESPLLGCWKYLLKDSTGREREYALENMADATTNMTNNIQAATLNNLSRDGIVEIQSDNGNVLTHAVMYNFNIMGQTIPVCEEYKDANGNVKNTLGELKIEEAIDYISYMLIAIDSLA